LGKPIEKKKKKKKGKEKRKRKTKKEEEKKELLGENAQNMGRGKKTTPLLGKEGNLSRS